MKDKPPSSETPGDCPKKCAPFYNAVCCTCRKISECLYKTPEMPESITFPDADESTWPPNAKKSRDEIRLLAHDMLGNIISDGERGYICTSCGKTITKAHHIKPELYAIIYRGQHFYLERHICDDCMTSFRRREKEIAVRKM